MSSPGSPNGLHDMVQQHAVAHDDRDVRSTVFCSGRVALENIRGQSCARNPQAGSAAQRRNHRVRRKNYTILHLAIADKASDASLFGNLSDRRTRADGCHAEVLSVYLPVQVPKIKVRFNFLPGKTAPEGLRFDFRERKVELVWVDPSSPPTPCTPPLR
jgi:hypothetical protein